MALTDPAATADPRATGPAPAAPGPAGRTAVGVPPAPVIVRRRPLLGSRKRQVGAALVIAGAVAFLIVQGLGNATQYYRTVPQAVADKGKLGTSQFRIMGTVENDVHQVAGRTEFDITYAGVVASVVDKKEPPQLFKPGIPVVLEGHWSGAVFQSDLIMVKHTANYTPPTDPAARSVSSARAK